MQRSPTCPTPPALATGRGARTSGEWQSRRRRGRRRACSWTVPEESARERRHLGLGLPTSRRPGPPRRLLDPRRRGPAPGCRRLQLLVSTVLAAVAGGYGLSAHRRWTPERGSAEIQG